VVIYYDTEVGLLNKSLCLAAALGVAKFKIDKARSHFVVLLKSDLNV
jgi:hypothetical protein